MMSLSCKTLIVILFLFTCFWPELYAWKGGHSRGGGVVGHHSFSKHKSHSSRTKSLFQKSPTVYIPIKSQDKLVQYNTQSEAIAAFRKSTDFANLPLTFLGEPGVRPLHIPAYIERENQTYPVTFQGTMYGYYHQNQFTPLAHEDCIIPDALLMQYHFYYRGLEPEARYSPWVGIVFLILLVVLTIYVFYLLISAFTEERQNQFKFQQPKEGPSNLFLQLHRAQLGQRIRFSDPLTLATYHKAISLEITDMDIYNHSQCRMFHLTLEGQPDQEHLELHLFCKEINDTFSLYLGILDHEGSIPKLLEEDWVHLTEDHDEFAEEFRAIFTLHDQDVPLIWEQCKEKPYYDAKQQRNNQVLHIAEYHPQTELKGLDWKHAVVLWEQDWISCYYCIFITEKHLAWV